MRQTGPLFGVSHAAAHRMIDRPLLALAPVGHGHTASTLADAVSGIAHLHDITFTN